MSTAMSTASLEQRDQRSRQAIQRALGPVPWPVSNRTPEESAEMHAQLEHLKRQQQQTSDRLPLAEDVRTTNLDNLL
jgi:hypothetical protein